MLAYKYSFYVHHFVCFFWKVQCIFIWAHYIDFRTLFVYLTQKKIRSYLDDDDKASLQEKGHLPVKDINDKISITGARFDFTPFIFYSRLKKSLLINLITKFVI